MHHFKVFWVWPMKSADGASFDRADNNHTQGAVRSRKKRYPSDHQDRTRTRHWNRVS